MATVTSPTAASSAKESSSTAGQARPPRHRRKVDRVYYVFLVPTLVIFTLSIILPAVMGVWYSLTNSIGFGEWDVIGLTNYRVLFTDPAIWQSYTFTMLVAASTVVIVNVVALMLAVGLTANIRLRTGLRAVFVMPMVISGIVIAYVFNFVFSNALPQLGEALGIDRLSGSILADPHLAWVAIVLVTAWQATPSALLVYIAGLLAVPGEVYEAAALDGASKLATLVRITLPLVAGYVAINVVIGFKNFLNSYDIIMGLTEGGPGTATRSVALTIVAGFTNGDYAYQMANATVFFVFVVAISLLQLTLTRGRSMF